MEVLEEGRQYIRAARYILTGISILLAVLAIINYCNTMITNMVIQKPQFAILKDIGMSEKQRKNLVIMEASIYLLVTVPLVIVSSSVLIVVANIFWK